MQTQYGPVKTDHMLFIAAGAFSADITPNDLLPELSGRLPIRIPLKPLQTVDYYNILTRTENSLLLQYVQLLSQEGLQIVFENDAVWAIAEYSSYMNHKQVQLGARRLGSVIEHVLQHANFFLCNLQHGTKLIITRDYVDKQCRGLLQSTSKLTDACEEFVL
jgi:ATP-dependent HslUV protease ATP-binding subunit HslU